MSRQSVGKVTPISVTSPSSPVDIGQTNSILTDPDGRWIAKRQSDINVALERRPIGGSRSVFDDDTVGLDGMGSRGAEALPLAQDSPPKKFSGESERIGKGNWGDKTPFGKRVGYL